MARRVFLVGFMGSGKTSYGRRAAVRSGWDFLDTDREIERRAAMSIPEIFARRGEEWFRELEQQVVREATTTERDTVIALGGGAVCHPGVMEMLGEAGTTVYLKMAPSRLVGRMSEAGRACRPKIAGMGDEELLDYIEKTLPGREKFYNKATFVLDCGSDCDEMIMRRLLEHMGVAAKTE